MHEIADRHRCRQCERLIIQNGELRERLRQIEESLSGRDLHLPVHLTPHELSITALLLKRQSVTREQLLTVIYGGPDRERGVEPKVLDVFVYRIRRKLRPFGVHICTRFGIGFYLEKDSHTRLRRLAGEEVAA